MARDPGKDILKNPTPTAGAAKHTVDAVLSMLKVGNGLVSLLAGLLASVMILYSGYVLYDNLATEYRAYSSSWDLLKYKPAVLDGEDPDEGKETLKAINEDYRGWLTVYDTTIDYPVVQGTNDLYYASHDIYRNSSLTGAIYLAAGNTRDFSDSYNVIYGHHMDNGAMFGSLDKFRDESYFRDHQTGIIVTESGIYDIKLFAVVSTDAYENQIYSVGNRAEEVLAFLNGDRSGDAGIGTHVLVYDPNTANGAKKIIALSTCADAETNGRLVVFGVMTERIIEPEDVTPTPTPEPIPTPTPTPTSGTKPAATDEPGETPEPDGTVRLIVRYLLGDEEVFPEEDFVHMPGDFYYVVSPQYPGYSPSIEIVEGNIYEDMTVIVRYHPNAYRLTIRYLYTDGTEAAETYTTAMWTGYSYDVESPRISGYTATHLRVTGTNSGKNEEYAVLYVPRGYTITRMEDYETPLGVGDIYLQIGICAE